jgi:hypothetical protein
VLPVLQPVAEASRLRVGLLVWLGSDEGTRSVSPTHDCTLVSLCLCANGQEDRRIRQ